MVSVAALLEARADDDRPGLRSADDGRAWTWREAVAECAVRAAWMAGRRGAERPVHVGVLLDNLPELVFLLGGAALSGSVIVALNTTRTAAELAGDAERADCDLVITQPRYAGQAAALGLPVHDVDAFRAELAPFEGAPLPDTSAVDPATLLMLIFTSGTSGRPRAVRVTHRKMVVPGEMLAERMLSPESVVYCPISLAPDPFGPHGALGKLADGIAILDPATGAPCPPADFGDAGRVVNGEEAIGELVNTGDLGLFDGYYKEEAPDRLRDGMFWSGDLAYADKDGYIFFAGRSADRLRVDGENFGAVQVERVLAELPGVRQLAVYGVPDAASGDQVMLAVAADGFDPDAFAGYLRGRADLGPKWPPRYVRVARELPATASNKILKRRLVKDGWRTDDPVWWRPGRDLAYRRMTAADAAELRAEFERRGRLHLLEGSG